MPCLESPVLQRAGVRRQSGDGDAPTMEAWRRARTSAYGRAQLQKTSHGDEEEAIHGITVTHYN